jgi:hypothetical protein
VVFAAVQHYRKTVSIQSFAAAVRMPDAKDDVCVRGASDWERKACK